MNRVTHWLTSYSETDHPKYEPAILSSTSPIHNKHLFTMAPLLLLCCLQTFENNNFWTSHLKLWIETCPNIVIWHGKGNILIGLWWYDSEHSRPHIVATTHQHIAPGFFFGLIAYFFQSQIFYNCDRFFLFFDQLF